MRNDYATVIDVGAHEGQFAIFALRLAPKADVHSFEPLARPRRKLKRVLKDTRATVLPYAIGAASGRTEMHVMEDDDSSSVLAPSQRQRSRFGTREAERTTVTMRTLDEIYPETPPQPVLLKLDVQGFELEALKGAKRLLPEVATVLVEASFAPFYEGQPLFHDVHSWLTQRGFMLIGGHCEAVSDSGRWEQGDFIFERVDVSPRSSVDGDHGA